MWENSRVPVGEPLSHLQAGCIQSINSSLKLYPFAPTEPVPVGDVERGSRSSLRGRYGEVMPVYRRDSHRDVQAGSHDYPGEGIYLLKFDNSYSLLRNKTLYFHIYYTS